MGRGASGVRGIKLNEGDEAIGMVCVSREDTQLMVVSENGYGKRSNIGEYRITSRGAKGVKALNITEKTGKLVSIKEVSDDDDLMIITTNGIAIRMGVANLRIMGRATQGVRLIKLSGKDAIASVAKIVKEDEINDDLEEGETNDTESESEDSPTEE